MIATLLGSENTEMTQGKLLRCSHHGWPGIGKMPAVVSMIKQNSKKYFIGQMPYFHASSVHCSVPQEMKSAVATRQWFVEAHLDYQNQIGVTEQMLGGRWSDHRGRLQEIDTLLLNSGGRNLAPIAVAGHARDR